MVKVTKIQSSLFILPSYTIIQVWSESIDLNTLLYRSLKLGWRRIGCVCVGGGGGGGGAGRGVVNFMYNFCYYYNKDCFQVSDKLKFINILKDTFNTK